MGKPNRDKKDHPISESAVSEEERLRKDIYRTDLEKLHLFSQMLRINNLFKKARITHK
jgi:hypothetical protein